MHKAVATTAFMVFILLYVSAYQTVVQRFRHYDFVMECQFGTPQLLIDLPARADQDLSSSGGLARSATIGGMSKSGGALNNDLPEVARVPLLTPGEGIELGRKIRLAMQQLPNG